MSPTKLTTPPSTDADRPNTLSEILEIVADFLDAGDQAFTALAQIQDIEFDSGSTVQQDLRSLAEFLKTCRQGTNKVIITEWLEYAFE
jgi:hypothetical protein